MSTFVDVGKKGDALWSGGGNLVLIDKVACIAAKHVGRYEDMAKELTIFFAGDVEKLRIVKSCMERMRDVSNNFKNERRAPYQDLHVPALLKVAQDLRERKKAFIKSTMEVRGTVDLTFAKGASTPVFVTPRKGVKTTSAKATFEERQKILLAMQVPIMTIEDLSPEDLKEAESVRESIQAHADQGKIEWRRKTSVENENAEMGKIFEVAFRALLAENVKKHEAYRSNSGSGDIRWDIEVKTLSKSENEVMHTAKAAYSSKLVAWRASGDSSDPRSLIDQLDLERVKYSWFVGMFMKEKKAAAAIRELEESMGQIIQSALLSSSESMQLYVSMAEENAEVKSGGTTLFSFYRTKFSRLKAEERKGGSLPTKQVRTVNHSEEVPEMGEMPESVKKAYDVLLQRPISKHPGGVPIKEVQTQSESTTVESIWELRNSADKVLAWAEKNKKSKKAQKENSDSEEEAKPRRRGEEKKSPAKGESETMLRKMEQRLQKLEKGDRGGTPNRKRERESDRGNQREKQICYGFRNTGRCSRGSDCKFSHDGAGAGGAGARPAERRGRLPDNVCDNLKRQGKCETEECPANHGKFDKSSVKKCNHEENGKICHFLFTRNGCRFWHSHAYEKN